MRAWAIIATLIAAGTLAAGGTLAAMLLRGGISARSKPSSLEASLGVKARGIALRGVRDRRNPVAPAPEGPEERQEEQDEESFLKGEHVAPAKGRHRH